MSNKTGGRNAVLICTLLFGICLYPAEATLRTNFMGFKNGSFNIYLSTQPTGILMSGTERNVRSFDHQVTLIPERFFSVVLSIYGYDISPDYQLIIKDSDNHKIALLGNRIFEDEKKSIISDGKMTIQFKTVGNVDFEPWYKIPRNSFQFTFTSVSDKPCGSDDFACQNGKCIKKEYLCDGHNHCGDNSDQNNCGPRNPQQFIFYKPRNTGVIWITTIAVCAIILVIVIAVFIAALIRHSKMKQAVSDTQNSANAGVGGNVPLQSVSSSVPHNQPPENVIQASAPPPDPPETFYNRFRNSFRRPKNTRTEEAPIPSGNAETYQVPSMYPSLDMLPSASEIDGNTNPTFKNDE